MERNAARESYVAARNLWLSHVKCCAECAPHVRDGMSAYRPECGAGLALAARQDALVMVPGALEEPPVMGRLVAFVGALFAAPMWTKKGAV